jgi:flagellar biosynthesis activator protein FlaF
MPGVTAALEHPTDHGGGSPRERDAAIFARHAASLRASARAGDVAQTRALEDNRLLWRTVLLLQTDPANALPAPLRRSIVALGFSLLHEMERLEPDFEFLAEMNEQVMAGLLSR